jgi:hypothetical protein
MNINKINIYYDLRVAPITFDAAVYFAAAVARCRLAGFNCFDVHIVAPSFRSVSPRDKTYDAATKNWRLTNILSRIPKLIKGVENVHLYYVDEIPARFPRFPESYNPADPKSFSYLFPELLAVHGMGGDVQVFSPSEFSCRWAQHVLGDDRTIVLTLRTADFDKIRDSNLDDWAYVYESLKSDGYRVVVVPDHMDCLFERRFSRYNWNVCSEAAIDLDLRLGLYTNALATIGSNGGHTAPLWLSSGRFMLFGTWNQASRLSNKEFLQRIGLIVGHQPVFFSDGQAFDWCEASLLNREYLSRACRDYIYSLKPR